VIKASRTAIAVTVLMCAASVASLLARPNVKAASELPSISLEVMIPTEFGAWREQPQRLEVVNPQTQELLDKLYNQVLSRTYKNRNGYQVMLSVAYGSDQRGGLQAHKPEVCYPAQGFQVHKNEPGTLPTAFGEIPVRRLLTSHGARVEPLTYWFTVGDTAVIGKTQKRLVDLRYGLTGRIPDGLLFRVSSIDPEPQRAYRAQEEFIKQLLETLSPEARKRLSGLDTLG